MFIVPLIKHAIKELYQKKNTEMKKNDKPYLDKPKKDKGMQEQLLYGNAPDVSEKKKKNKEYKDKMLNE